MEILKFWTREIFLITFEYNVFLIYTKKKRKGKYHIIVYMIYKPIEKNSKSLKINLDS